MEYVCSQGTINRKISVIKVTHSNRISAVPKCILVPVQ